ncbi:MAG: S8 family serine peptidase [Candidatus Heimdallarchaeota archaeon]|nr:S8 family serine peptidase [Candidatus Heimdallarchaeota archaeon]
MSTNIKHSRLFCAIIIFLLIPLTITGFGYRITNSLVSQESANDSYNNYFITESLPETYDTTSEVKPLPGKEYVELYQTDFASITPNEKIDVTIIFNDNVIWNFPDLIFNYQYKYLNGFKASIPTSMFDYLKAKPYVKYIYEREIINGTMDYDLLDWGVDRTDAEIVWGGSENANDIISGYPTGAGVKVGVFDSGFDYYHDDLNNNYCGGYDFGESDNDPIEEEDPYEGHGTHVAGIIAAEDNGINTIGVAPEVDLYALKVWFREWDMINSEYNKYLANLDEAVEWAIENDLDIICMPIDAGSDIQAFHDAIDIAYNKGISIFASAGNDYGNYSQYPACYSSVIQVGAITRLDNLAGYSNYGPTQEFVAPGGIFGDGILSTDLGGGSAYMHGTSMAVAMVSGVCALLHSVTSNIMPEEIRYILKNSADDLGSGGYDQYYGWGCVDADAAIDLANGTDSDSDGIINTLETYVWGTDPYDSDSDDDGLNDRLEIRIYHSDPNDPDTDKDSLTDYAEAITYGTDPTDEDSDSDGYHDQMEILLEYDPCDYSHHPQQAFLMEDGEGEDNSWIASDSPYNVVTENSTVEGYDTIKNTEYNSHFGADMFANTTAIDLTNWDGENDLHLTFRFRCTSDYSSSTVTQFRLKFYDASISDYISFDNPTSYTYYRVDQSNRDGQTWLSGYDSDWQAITFTLLASDFEDFSGTDDQLFLVWGHHDSWSSYYDQTEYLDYLLLSEEDNAVVPDQPRDFTGIGDGISQIALYWKSPSNVLADKYIIERKVSGVYTWQANVTQDGAIDATQYWADDDTLSTGVTYYYRIRAVHNELAGDYAYWSGTV